MNNFGGYTSEQRFRVAWRVKGERRTRGSESMTRPQAETEKARREAEPDVVEAWIEEYNHWGWERV